MITLLLIRHGIAENPRPACATRTGPSPPRAGRRPAPPCAAWCCAATCPPGASPAPTAAPRRPWPASRRPPPKASRWPAGRAWSPAPRPPGPRDWLRGLVAEAQPFDTIALVSHQPFLFGPDPAPHRRTAVEMKKASCAVLHWNGGRFELAAPLHSRPAAGRSMTAAGPPARPCPGACTLHYRVQGPPGAPWLVLLNGLLSDTTMWAGVLPGLTARSPGADLRQPGPGPVRRPGGGPLPGRRCWPRRPGSSWRS